jgi:hypothetical protein
MDALTQRLFEKERTRGEKALVLLSLLGGTALTPDLREYAIGLGFRDIVKWNLSDVLRKEVPRCVLKPTGWSLTDEGERYLSDLGYETCSPLVSKTRGALEKHVQQIGNSERKEFAQEAVACFNGGLHRAAVVLSWVGAIHIIEEHIVGHRLAQFNAAGRARPGKHFRDVLSIEHFTRMQEVEILQISEDIGLMDKSVKKQLNERLDLRNACGHPNKVIIDEHSVAHHVEFLLNNVYKRF